MHGLLHINCTHICTIQHEVLEPATAAIECIYLQEGHVGQGRSQELVSHIVMSQLQMSVSAESSSELV